MGGLLWIPHDAGRPVLVQRPRVEGMFFRIGYAEQPPYLTARPLGTVSFPGEGKWAGGAFVSGGLRSLASFQGVLGILMVREHLPSGWRLEAILGGTKDARVLTRVE